MCPMCIGSTLLIAMGGVSAGGLLGLGVSRASGLRSKKRAQKCGITHAGDEQQGGIEMLKSGTNKIEL